MTQVVDPESGLAFVELSHPWGMYTPIFHGYEEIKLERITHHAKQGVMTHKITTIFHTSTHVNAPIHLIPQAPAVGDLALDSFFGTGVVLSIPKGKWELIEPKDLETATPAVLAGDIVLINTGWHRRYADSKEYFGHAPGLSEAAARWLVEKKVKLVGVDTACVDHPLATSLGRQFNATWGPLMRTGGEKSHLAWQVERFADVYTSRVSNFLYRTPFAYLRAPRGSLPHETVG